jgi:hypothetical protein
MTSSQWRFADSRLDPAVARRGYRFLGPVTRVGPAMVGAARWRFRSRTRTRAEQGYQQASPVEHRP